MARSSQKKSKHSTAHSAPGTTPSPSSDLALPTHQIRVLVVEDDADDRLAVCRALQQSRFNPVIEQTADMASGLEALKEKNFDIVILDHLLPDGKSRDFLYHLRNRGQRVPIILITGYGDEMLVADSMKAGVSDYLPKDKLSSDHLTRAIAHAIRVHRAEEDLRRKDILLEASAQAAILLHTQPDRLTVMSGTLGILGKAVDADRVVVFEMHTHTETRLPAMTHRFEWSRNEDAFTLNDPSWRNVTFDSCGLIRWPGVLASGHAMAGPLVRFPEPEQKLFGDRGVRSLLVVPVLVDGKCWGFVQIEDWRADRSWTVNEQAIFSSMATAVGVTLIHRRADDALRQSEERYRKLVENGPAILYTATLDAASTTTYISPQVERTLGFTQADYQANPDIWRQRLHPQDRDRVMAEVEKSRSAHQVFVSEYRLLAKDGHVVWMRDEASYICDANGKPVLLQGVMYDITDRKQAEAAKRVTEEKYQTLIENLNMGVFRTSADAEGRFIEVNAAHVRMLGFESADDLMRTRVADLYVNPAERTSLLDALRKQVYLRNHMVHLRKRDGTPILASLTARAHFSADGQMDWLDGVIEDITEQRQTEQALDKSREYLDKIINSIGDPIFVKDREHRLVLANDAECALIGRPRLEILGRTDYDFFPKQQVDVFWAKDEEVFRTGQENINEEQITRADGITRTIVTKKTLYTDPSGNQFIVGVIRDITDISNAEAALRAGEARYRSLAEGSPDMVFLVDREGRVLYANAMALRQFLLPPDKVIGARQEDLFPPELAQRHLLSIQKVFDTGVLFATEVPEMLQRHDIWIDTRLVPVRDDAGQVTAVLGIARDVTDRRRTEEERRRLASNLLEVQENERKEISATLHDHLGQLLTLSRLELGSIRVADEDSKKSVDNALSRLDEALGSVRHLAVSLRPPILDDLGIVAALETLAEELSDGSDIQAGFRVEGVIPDVGKEAATCLYRVLQEALTNTARHSGATQVNAILRSEPDRLCLEIRDNGRGFDVESAAAQGGIGFVNMRERLARCGGRLEVHSEQGHGTTIFACIPRKEPSPRAEAS
jgi:PAS domain S-box-containing protein